MMYYWRISLHIFLFPFVITREGCGSRVLHLRLEFSPIKVVHAYGVASRRTKSAPCLPVQDEISGE